MTIDLKQLLAAGVAVELKPGCRYLIFVDSAAMDVDALRHAEPIDSDVEIVPLMLPPDGTVQDAVVAFELQPTE